MNRPLHLLALGLFFQAAAVLAQDKAPPSAAKAARKPSAAAAPVCVVADFRTLAFTHHVPQERANLATQWLRSTGPQCSEAQILMIRANSAAWLGVADTPAIMGLLERLVEARQMGKPELLQSLYSSPAAERDGAPDVVRATGGLRTVVPPVAPLPPMMLGSQVPAMPAMPTQPTPPRMPSE